MNTNDQFFKSPRHADVLALGFGTTVAMWGIAYLCRLPQALAPAWLLVLLLLACQFVGGYLTGRHTGRGWRGGLYVGLLSSVLNILIMGSLLSSRHEPNEIVPSALWWLPGALLVGAVMGAAGAVVGGAGGRKRTEEIHWFGWFTKVAATATFFLIIIGGTVTAEGAGLAVVDWPNSFGYNMFLYPLSKMSGDIYFEHAHRLFGSLVGLTTLVLVIHLFIYDRRSQIRWFSLAALVIVIIQGILGGLRVTGRFTWSTSRAHVEPSLSLAIVHGVLGQIFFASMVAIAVVTSARWLRREPAAVRPTISMDRGLTATLVGLLIIQLVLGAIQRHLLRGLLIHITTAVVVVGLAIACGTRAWGLYSDRPVLPRLGKLLLTVVCVQVVLGMAAAAMIGIYPDMAHPPLVRVLVTTAHQAMGAFLLATATMLAIWTHRIAVPEGARRVSGNTAAPGKSEAPAASASAAGSELSSPTSK